jgi:hypothetical protein
MYRTLLRFWQNSAGSGRIWQNLAEIRILDTSVLVVETGGHVQGVTG